jgi:hypothetical protein
VGVHPYGASGGSVGHGRIAILIATSWRSHPDYEITSLSAQKIERARLGIIIRPVSSSGWRVIRQLSLACEMRTAITRMTLRELRRMEQDRSLLERR